MTDQPSHIEGDSEFSQDFVIRQEALSRLEARLLSAPIAITAALAEYAPSADDYQKAVIVSTAEVIRMVAPAGSGKTQTIINRLLSRIKAGDRPSRLLCLTFDRSAAEALREKLAIQLATLEAGDRIADIEISTLNAYGYRILRERFPHAYKRIPNSDGVRYGKLQYCFTELQRRSPERHALLPRRLQRRFYLDFFSLLKNELFDPRDLEIQRVADFILEARQAGVFFEDNPLEEAVRSIVQAIVWLFQKLDQSLDAIGLMDFDDQKLRAYKCLQEAPEVLHALQSSLTEVIVDEFQDINRLDFALIKDLAAKSRLVVTGDDDQAIYGFRGCSPEFIINLEQHLHRPVTSYTLDINYRSPPNIVSHADKLIRHNTNRIDKNPKTARTDPSDIKVISSISAGLEARACVAVIKRALRSSSRLRHTDVAILYRTNAQSLPVQVEFILSDIPYRVRAEDNIVNNELLPRLLRVLNGKTALAKGREPEPADGAEIICGYFRWINPTARTAVESLCVGLTPFWELVQSDRLTEALPRVSNDNLAQAIRDLVAARTLPSALTILSDRFRGLRGIVGSLEDAMDDRLPLGEVAEVAANFGGSIEDFISTMSNALRRAREQNAGEDEDGVGLLTYFKSKGRQWHTVILTSCNEGLIPHSRAPVEEERRLFYVAITRPSANLYVSYVKSAVGSTVSPSRFLSEAGLL